MPASDQELMVDDPRPLPAEDVEALLAECGDDLFLFLLGLLRNRHDAEDAWQQAVQRLLEEGGTAAADRRRAWLFTVAYRQALLGKRQAATTKRVHRAWWHWRGASPGSEFDNQQPASPTFAVPALERLIQDESAARAKQALQDLPEEHRHVVEQRVFHEKTFAQIAHELNLPIGTVLTRMRRALVKLEYALTRPSEPRRPRCGR